MEGKSRFDNLSAASLAELSKQPGASINTLVEIMHALSSRDEKQPGVIDALLGVIRVLRNREEPAAGEALQSLSAHPNFEVKNAAREADQFRLRPKEVKDFVSAMERELVQAGLEDIVPAVTGLITFSGLSSKKALLEKANLCVTDGRRRRLSDKPNSVIHKLERLVEHLMKKEKPLQVVEKRAPGWQHADKSSGSTPALSRLMEELAAGDSPAGNGHKASPGKPGGPDDQDTGGVMDWKTVVVENIRKNAGDEAAKVVEHLMKSRAPASLRQLHAIMQERVSGIPADTPEKQNIRIALRALNLQSTSGTARTPPKTPQR